MRSTLIQFSFVLVFLIVLNVSCEHAEAPTSGIQPGPPGDSVKPSFDSIQVAVFSQSCAFSGCHAGSNPTGGLNLEEGQAYDNLVNVQSREIPRYMRVEPNNPDSSYLIMKLEGSDKIIGQQMPADGDPLSQEQIDYIREWINDGAKNN